MRVVVVGNAWHKRDSRRKTTCGVIIMARRPLEAILSEELSMDTMIELAGRLFPEVQAAECAVCFPRPDTNEG